MAVTDCASIIALPVGCGDHVSFLSAPRLSSDIRPSLWLAFPVPGNRFKISARCLSVNRCGRESGVAKRLPSYVSYSMSYGSFHLPVFREYRKSVT